MKKLIALKGCSFACIYFVVTIENFEFKILIAQSKFFDTHKVVNFTQRACICIYMSMNYKSIKFLRKFIACKEDSLLLFAEIILMNFMHLLVIRNIKNKALSYNSVGFSDRWRI